MTNMFINYILGTHISLILKTYNTKKNVSALRNPQGPPVHTTVNKEVVEGNYNLKFLRVNKTMVLS